MTNARARRNAELSATNATAVQALLGQVRPFTAADIADAAALARQLDQRGAALTGRLQPGTDCDNQALSA